MKNQILIFVFSLFFITGHSQNSEFQVYDNGLIYSEATMNQLSHIVDSLNLKFNNCDLEKTYLSKKQTTGHFISLDKNKIQAKKDIESGISFSKFMVKYPDAEVTKNVIITFSKNENSTNNYILDGLQFNANSYSNPSINITPKSIEQSINSSSNWFLDRNIKYGFAAFFISEPWKSIAVKEEYARMIQYVDCMIDTSSAVFLVDRQNRVDPENYKGALKAFYDFKNQNKPEQPKKKDNAYYESLKKWNKYIEEDLSKTKKFQTLFRAAVDYAIENKMENIYLERNAAKFYSKEKELDLKRCRIVHGFCSQDDSPRLHAVDIAVTSAEAAKWEVFLRAHLNIMNDFFHRMSDGSYAMAGRKTYILELEKLDIDITDLLIGTSFRISNPDGNHYYSSIGRIGRALSETKYQSELEDKLLQITSDNELDLYNRALTFYLFLNYNYYLEDKNRQMKNKEKLKKLVSTFPESFHSDLNNVILDHLKRG